MESKEPTPEEIAEFEAKMTKHYEEKLPFLRIHAEFHMLNADIAEARLRTLSANSQFAQAMAQQQKLKEQSQEENKNGNANKS